MSIRLIEHPDRLEENPMNGRVVTTTVCMLALTWCAIGVYPSFVRAEDEESRNLFRPVPVQKAALLPKEQEKQLTALRDLPSTVGVWVAEINLGMFRQKSLNLNVTTEKSLPVVTDRVEKRSDNDFTWFGKMDGLGVRGEAILVSKDGQVTGTIQSGADLYEIVPLGSGNHAVVKVDPAKLPQDEGPHPNKVLKLQEKLKKEHQDKGSENLIDKSQRTADGKYLIKPIVAYTPAARTEAGGKGQIESKIQLAVDATNKSYENSGISIRMQLAHAYETNYQESGNSELDLKRFRDKGDNYMDEVHSLRDRHRAQVGVLIVSKAYAGDGTPIGGLASSIGANAETAFCVVMFRIMVARHVFAHEIGHLQGARHNWEAPGEAAGLAPTLGFPHGHGFWHKAGGPNENWSTIMSYACPGNKCPRVLYWSNPDISINGVPTGSKDCCNNAAVLNSTAKAISSFR
ncbi:MAG: M12 family metallo-peptidase [Thermodesulfobacteriota bacterium]